MKSVGKETTGSGDLVCCIRPQGGGGVRLWLLFADTVLKPITQTFIVCQPAGSPIDEEGFCGEPPEEYPFELEMLCRRSRLCDMEQGSFEGLWHLTSDEMILSLVLRGEQQHWEVSQVKYNMATGKNSLRYMLAASTCEAELLEAQKRAKVAADDPFLQWLRLSKEGASSRGSKKQSRTTRPPLVDSGRSIGQGSGATSSTVLPQVALELEEEEDPDLFGDGEFDDIILEDMLSELLSEELLPAECQDEVLLGDGQADQEQMETDHRESGASAAAASAEEPEQQSSDGPNGELIAVVDDVAAAFSVATAPQQGAGAPANVAASSSASQIEQFPESGFIISDLGYVRCNWPGHDPANIIGLVGWKRDGKSIFAGCHLHSVCSVSAGTQRQNIPPEHMAKWLCMGQPAPPGASVSERKQLGVEHRKLWARPA